MLDRRCRIDGRLLLIVALLLLVEITEKERWLLTDAVMFLPSEA